MYVKVVNNEVDTYPYNLDMLRYDNPNISFPRDFEVNKDLLAEFGIFVVYGSGMPTFDDKTQRVVEVDPVLVEDIWVRKYDVVALTEKEVTDITEIRVQEVRSKRNILLLESDWTQLPDAPANTVTWATYRQELRDITLQEGYPFDIVWPVKP